MSREEEGVEKMETIRSRISLLRNDINMKLDEMDALVKQLEDVENGGGKSFDVVKGGGEGGEVLKDAPIQGPEERAMTNPVILSKLFSYLDLGTLVSSRSVCKVWGEVVVTSPEFSRKIYLHVSRLFPCLVVAPVPKLNSKLAKNIHINDWDWINKPLSEGRHDSEQVKVTAAKILMAFFDQYHHYVENIMFHGEDFDYFNILLVKAINALDFPKLQGIVIKANAYAFYSGPSWDMDKCAPFPIRPNLRSLQFDETIYDSRLQGVFQKLINSATNLEEVTIRGNFHPDLSTCKNLKILNYTGNRCYYRGIPLFNLSSLSDMLDQVKHSIIKLSLEDSYVYDCSRHRHQEGHTQLEEFKFPDVAKKLEFLSIKDVYDKPYFQLMLKKLNPVQFPKLKTLLIRVMFLNNVLEEISHSFVTISSLHLSGSLIVSPELRHRIHILFPNLTNLTMPWSRRYGELDFDAIIDFCSGWKLLKLSIDTNFQSEWSALMKELGRLKQTQKDIRMLKLWSSEYPERDNPVLDLWYDVKKQQQELGTVSVDHILQNLTFGPQSVKEALEDHVLQFLLDHSLLVHFV